MPLASPLTGEHPSAFECGNSPAALPIHYGWKQEEKPRIDLSDPTSPGEGANSSGRHLPVKLLYYEEFDRIDDAYFREKQVQGWSRKKKEALVNRKTDVLHALAKCQNATSSELWHQNNHPSAKLRDPNSIKSVGPSATLRVPEE